MLDRLEERIDCLRQIIDVCDALRRVVDQHRLIIRIQRLKIAHLSAPHHIVKVLFEILRQCIANFSVFLCELLLRLDAHVVRVFGPVHIANGRRRCRCTTFEQQSGVALNERRRLSDVFGEGL